MLLGYNTNGFANHQLEDAVAILGSLGYQSIALSLDYHALNPFDPAVAAQGSRLQRLLDDGKLRSVIETGARFLLDPRRKHQPTLISPDQSARARRREFLCQAVDIAEMLNSDAVSFWSGAAVDDASAETLLDRLVAECVAICEYAASKGVRLAFEPEPGMFIDTMDRFATLQRRVAQPNFGLTIDIGHLHCLGEVPIADRLRQWAPLLWNIHIEDMRRGVHDHLMFGEGEIDFAPVLRTLDEIGYQDGVHVELSRHSHDAVATAQRALDFLRRHQPGFSDQSGEVS